MDPLNVLAKFEIRSFSRPWDNRGYRKKMGSPWIRPRSLFCKYFTGLLFGWTPRMYWSWACTIHRDIYHYVPVCRENTLYSVLTLVVEVVWSFDGVEVFVSELEKLSWRSASRADGRCVDVTVLYTVYTKLIYRRILEFIDAKTRLWTLNINLRLEQFACRLGLFITSGFYSTHKQDGFCRATSLDV